MVSFFKEARFVFPSQLISLYCWLLALGCSFGLSHRCPIAVFSPQNKDKNATYFAQNVLKSYNNNNPIKSQGLNSALYPTRLILRATFRAYRPRLSARICSQATPEWVGQVWGRLIRSSQGVQGREIRLSLPPLQIIALT